MIWAMTRLVSGKVYSRSPSVGRWMVRFAYSGSFEGALHDLARKPSLARRSLRMIPVKGTGNPCCG